MLGDTSRPLDFLPDLLRLYWQTLFFVCLDLSTARVVLVLGGTACRDYVRYLEERGRRFKTILLPDNDSLTVAVVEYEDDDQTTMKRLAQVTYHPERYARHKNLAISNNTEILALRERIIEVAMAMLYGEANTQRLFSGCYYIFNMSSVTFVPMQTLLSNSKTPLSLVQEY